MKKIYITRKLANEIINDYYEGFRTLYNLDDDQLSSLRITIISEEMKRAKQAERRAWRKEDV